MATRFWVVILSLDSTWVRHTEIFHPALGTQHKKDVNFLEWIQRRVTKIITVIEHLSYEERLKELELSSLKERRLRGCFIVAFQY